MAAPFTYYDPETHDLSALVDALVNDSSGFEVVDDSVELKFGTTDGDSSLSFYDGSLEDIGIGEGLLLTSGDGAPNTQNQNSGYSKSFNQKFTETADGKSDGYSIDQKVKDVAQDAYGGAGKLTDASILTFDIEVPEDSNLKSIKFDFAFGSEEYPNYIDSSFVDTASLFVNDKNFALFNGNTEQPLSVISENVQMGNFKNNSGTYKPSVPTKLSNGEVESVEYPIEYNAISEPLSVTAPVQEGTNTITIAVSDTGDKILDTGLFVSALQGKDYSVPEDGTGVNPSPPEDADPDNPFADDIYDLPYELEDGAYAFGKDGMDGSLIEGSPDDLITAKFDFGLDAITDVEYEINSEDKSNYVDVESDYGSQKFVYVDKMIFDDQDHGFAAAMDTWEGSDTWNTFSLLKVAFGQEPTPEIFTEWRMKADDTDDTSELAAKLLDEEAPDGFTSEDLVSYLHKQITGDAPSSDVVDSHLDFLSGVGMTENNKILGFVADNYADMSEIQGSFVPMDLQVYKEYSDEQGDDNGDSDAPFPGDGDDDDDNGESEDTTQDAVFVEDFENGNDWTNTQSSNATQASIDLQSDNAGDHYLMATVQDQEEEWHAYAQSPTFQAIEPGDDFSINFEFNPIQPDWGHYPGIYFVSAGETDNHPLKFSINNSDGTGGQDLFTLGGQAMDDKLQSQAVSQTDVWYDVSITHDSNQQELELEILDPNGDVFFNDTVSNFTLPNSFNQIWAGEKQGDTKYGQEAKIGLDDIQVTPDLELMGVDSSQNDMMASADAM